MAASKNLTPQERTERARLAALTRWARTPDRVAATEAMRAGLLEKYAAELDPNGEMPEDERYAGAERLRLAALSRGRLRASQARRAC